MRKFYIYFGIYLLLLLLASCNTNEPISIKEKISNEIVVIEPSISNHLTKDSVSITVPIELEITQKNLDIKNLDLYFITINKKRLLHYGIDYQTYDKENLIKPKYFSLDEEELASRKKISIIIKIATQMISRKQAEELLYRYKISQKLDDLKNGGIIKIKPYNQFREENPIIIEEFQRISDSLVFSISSKKGKDITVKQKINW